MNLVDYLSYEELERNFIAAFSKTGLKHDVLSQIHGFKQKADESVRDGANRLQQYLARCPKEEIPSQERLVSIFLEGLLNRELHASLYMKHHKNLNQCINDVVDFDDNYGTVDKKSEGKGYSPSSSNSSIASQVEEITKGVMEKLQQLYNPPRTSEPWRVDRPYVCGNCGGNHPTS